MQRFFRLIKTAILDARQPLFKAVQKIRYAFVVSPISRRGSLGHARRRRRWLHRCRFNNKDRIWLCRQYGLCARRRHGRCKCTPGCWRSIRQNQKFRQLQNRCVCPCDPGGGDIACPPDRQGRHVHNPSGRPYETCANPDQGAKRHGHQPRDCEGNQNPGIHPNGPGRLSHYCAKPQLCQKLIEHPERHCPNNSANGAPKHNSDERCKWQVPDWLEHKKRPFVTRSGPYRGQQAPYLHRRW